MTQGSPFDPDNGAAYKDWRDAKLAEAPADARPLLVRVGSLSSPSAGERAEILARSRRFNMAIYVCGEAVDKTSLLGFARSFGLESCDMPLYAGEQGITEIRNIDGGRQGEYAPYTDRALSWHTDGYYNPPGDFVRAMLLHCVRPAASGGDTALLDHEIAYIKLRDENPDFIRAMTAPDALTIPENVEGGKLIRPAVSGPVFSVIEGRLHMRYSARGKYVEWKKDHVLEMARASLTRLLDDPDGPVVRHRLGPGQGLICNNVLHARTSFEDRGPEGRLMLRARFRDPMPAADAAREQQGETHAR